MEKLLTRAARAGIRFEIDGDELRVTAPQGALSEELRQELRLYKGEILSLLRSDSRVDESLPVLETDWANRSEPFPLTDLQHAYWLGRDSVMEMGGVATHLYVELDCQDLHVARLNDALRRLIDRHDMLRAVVNRDGMQRILPTVPDYIIAVNDQSKGSPDAIERGIAATRDALSHQVFKSDQWPLFEVRVTLLPDCRARLHVSQDLLILDAWSISLFFREWHQLYMHPETVTPELGVSFRDYVFAERRRQNSAAYKSAQAYWMNRIETLPAAPDLPLRSDISARARPRFSRRAGRLDKARWEKLRARARSEGLTPSGLLLAAYSEVLARWSSTSHFTLNVTVSNRLQLHADINNILGDFTSLMLHEVDHRDPQLTFLEFARGVRHKFTSDLEHSAVSGVTVMREWAKYRGSSLQAVMPVVFSSGLIWSGDDEVGDLEQFGKKVYSISQTSQVWLDHHVMEINGDLDFVWDAADAVFEEGVLDAMFTAYCSLIERLVDDPALWESRNVVPLPAAMAQRRELANQTKHHQMDRRLHSGFVSQAFRQPLAAAVISPERTLSYGELLAESAAVADWLIQRGLRPGKLVAVLTHKGWEQIVAVCGVLLAGGAYMPVDADLPTKRQQELLRIGEVKHVLTQPGVMREEISAASYDVFDIHAGAQGVFRRPHAQSLDSGAGELAYVIFTSGTTGVPKGVMIDHRGAANTVDQVNRMFSVGPADRVLAVSSLSFDLSVYDIFGLLSAGGALVIPDYRKGHDPVHWRELIAQHHVTLWNSAPQLMRMLMDSFYVEEKDTAALRTVFLSGDFIPLDLPDRIRKRYTQAEVISLGGATEVSIWSIYHPVKAVDPGWTSIPYGRPLPNQTVWVYDQALRPCPDFVTGRIFIGGMGLAKGYWQDAEKTASRFIVHPESGERLYDTSDLGRYAPDGTILILGRDDGQVKIRGHRVELGEIETVLCQHPEIRQAVVLPTAGSSENRQLAAYVELTGDEITALGHTENMPAADPEASRVHRLHVQAVKDYLADRLPEYMVPRYVVQVDHIPVSANGKIDYRGLPVISEEAMESMRDWVAPRNEVEQTIFDAWSRVIVGCEIGVTDNFFELGGDSILATQIVREINAAMPAFNLEIHELFENITIESLAALFQSRSVSCPQHAIPGSDDMLRMDGASSPEYEAIISDYRAAVDSFGSLDFNQDQKGPAASPQAVLITGATGWLGVHVLAELLAHTPAEIHCLVRSRNEADGHRRLLESMRQHGIVIDPAWQDRVKPVCGDLSRPQLGMGLPDWRRISSTVDSIYHLGASVNVLVDYSTHRKVNVNALVSIVRLAVEHHIKPVFFSSPMAVCRRYKDGRLLVLPGESSHADPDGLLTGYSQSKWAAEQILLAAAQRGLPVKIYRTSHALPSTRSGKAKKNDTYDSILKAAYAAGIVPDWTDSRLYGVPVDTLGRLIVDNSLDSDGYRGVIHIENQDPLSLKSIIEILLQEKQGGNGDAMCVPVDEWKTRCLEAAAGLPEEIAGLVKVLFTKRALGTAVDNMFSEHPVDTHYLNGRGQAQRISGLTPVEYWRAVFLNPSWGREEVYCG